MELIHLDGFWWTERKQNQTKKAFGPTSPLICGPLDRMRNLSCADRDGEEVDLRREDWDTEEGHVYTWHR